MTVNRFAGMGSYQSARSATDTWFTPPAIIEALGGWESFDLDPCSHVDRPWPTARQHYTIEDNGLIQRWVGRCWINPPYSIQLFTRFMARMAEHNHGTALAFARTETVPFQKYVWGAAAGVLFLRGRLNFHQADGTRAEKNGGAPSVLIAYGEQDMEILAAAPIDGHFVPLRLPSQFIVSALKLSWSQALAEFFAGCDEVVSLAELYRAFQRHPKTRSNQHWQAKLRQVLQRGQYERVEKGLWRRAA